MESLELAEVEILKTMPAGAIVVEKSSGKIVFINDRFIELMGFNPKGTSFKDFALNIVRARKLDGGLYLFEDLPLTKALLHGKTTTNQEMILQKFDKTDRMVRVNAKPLFRDRGEITGAIATFDDITELKKAEQALMASEDEYRSLFDNMSDGLACCQMIFEDNYKPVDFVYLKVNAAFEKITGLSKEQVIGKKVSQAIPGTREAHPELIERYGRVALTGKSENFDIFFKPLSLWLHVSTYSTEKGHFVAIFENIDDRKKAEEALKESEERFSKAFTNSQAASAITRFEDGLYIDVNESFVRLSEFTKDELIGHTPWELKIYDPDERTKIVGIVRAKGLVRDYELYAKTKTGKAKTVLFSMQPIVLNGQECAITTFIDITDRKEAEEALKESEHLYRTLFENTEDGFQLLKLLSDEEGKPSDLLLLEVNKAYERQTGLKASDVLGKTLREYLPNVESYWITSYSDVAKTGKASHIENFNRDTNRWYDVYAFPYKEGQVGVLFRDITQRKKVEEALKESNERFKTLANGTAAMLWVNDEKGNHIFVNRGYLDYFKVAEDQVSGKNWQPLIHPDDRSEYLGKAMDSIAKREPFHEETRVRRGDGEWRWVETIGIPRFSQGGEYLGHSGLSLDITERKKAEEEVERLASFPMLNPSPIIEVTFDGKIEYINSAAKTQFPELQKSGLSHPILSGFSIILKKLREEPERPFNIEVKALNNWYLQQCYIVPESTCVRIYSLNINERKKAEEAIKVGEEKYRQLYESFDEAFIATDWEFNVIHWNKAAERVTTVAAKDALGKKVYEVLPEMLSVDITPYFEALKIKKPARFTMNVVSRETRKPSIFEISTYPSDLGIIIIVEDITEEEETKRLSVIGTTAGMVGHDIRNPLQAIVSDIYLLRDELNVMSECKNKEIAESIDAIENNVVYINKIVQDLQDFSRTITPEYKEINLTDVLTNIFKIISVPDKIKLYINVKDAEKLRTDTVLLQRALSNLVTNAIQAMPNGGNLEIGGQLKNSQIVITVKDTGMGIPDEIKPKLFTPMMTTKAKGQGFGLAVSKRLIEAMNGTISFESEKGTGTTFVINLPLAQSKSP
jgi:PAS domain S-box-containing protein